VTEQAAFSCQSFHPGAALPALPDPKLPFQVIADASDAIGAVLMQNDKPIAFEGASSTTLSRSTEQARSCGLHARTRDVASVSALLYAAVRFSHDNLNVYFLTKALDRDTKRKAEESLATTWTGSTSKGV
jgi:hypothetical protein